MSKPKTMRFEHRAHRRNFVATWHDDDDLNGVPPGWNVVEILRDGWKTPVADGLTTRRAAMDAIRNEVRS